MNIRLHKTIKDFPGHSHICAFYSTPQQRPKILAAYYTVGLERKELCVYVTHQKPAAVMRQLSAEGLDIANAVRDGGFLILPANEIYLPNGTFTSSAMLTNLRNIVVRAETLGYAGVRGGGDMKWLMERAHEWDDAAMYEAKINRFIKINNFNGICLFPRQSQAKPLVRNMIRNHQTVIHNTVSYPNPYYVPPEQYLKFKVDLVAQLEGWSDRMDEQETEAHKVIATLMD